MASPISFICRIDVNVFFYFFIAVFRSTCFCTCFHNVLEVIADIKTMKTLQDLLTEFDEFSLFIEETEFVEFSPQIFVHVMTD